MIGPNNSLAKMKNNFVIYYHTKCHSISAKLKNLARFASKVSDTFSLSYLPKLPLPPL